MTPYPIKRSDFLVTLSRDHHAGLLFCWKIKEGLKKGASFERIAGYIRFFWEDHLQKHFREEEILLFNQHDSELTRRGKEEHVGLEKTIGVITGGQTAESDYILLAGQLIAHIRFEERELFPYLEKTLAEASLAAIRDILVQLHVHPFNDNYPDEFWIKSNIDHDH